MSDSYLLEGSDVDRYLLEDGTGIYLINVLVTANPLAPTIEDCARVAAADGWPTEAEVVAFSGRPASQVAAMIAQLESEGSIHVGPNGKIRVRPTHRTFRW